MNVHPSLTEERVCEAVRRDDDIGFCIDCGHEQDRCEPDARKYECESCGQKAVFGAEELCIMIAL